VAAKVMAASAQRKASNNGVNGGCAKMSAASNRNNGGNGQRNGAIESVSIAK